MYFFISLRRKGLQSAGAAVSKMVRMGDFSFIKFA